MKNFKAAGVGMARRISSNENSHIPVGLAVRICGSHPQGPGSTPGLGTFLILCKNTSQLSQFVQNW